MRHKPAPECPAVNASACCGNLDNLKEFPAIGGERCLATVSYTHLKEIKILKTETPLDQKTFIERIFWIKNKLIKTCDPCRAGKVP